MAKGAGPLTRKEKRFSRTTNLNESPCDGTPSTCNIQISIEKSGTMFMILESSPLEIGGGYRVTLWSFNKQQVMEMISSMEVQELT